MTKFHVNPAGDAGPCSAKKNCPFGSASEHYDTVEEATAAAEKQLASEYGSTVGNGKTKEAPELNEEQVGRAEDYFYDGEYSVRMADKGFAKGTQSFEPGDHRVEHVEVYPDGDVVLTLDPNDREPNEDVWNNGMDAYADQHNLAELSEAEVDEQAERIADEINREYTDNAVGADYFDYTPRVRMDAEELRDHIEKEEGIKLGEVHLVPSDSPIKLVNAEGVKDAWEILQD